MFPFDVDPNWYEEYWYSDRPQPRHGSFTGGMARFAVLVALLAGGGAVLSRFHSDPMSLYQDWEQE
jgi:hypothetical protein